MGFFLNPKEGPAEWLYNNAMRFSPGEAGRFDNWKEEILLCLVRVAEEEFILGIVFDDAERKAFAMDGNPKQWYVCNRKIVEKSYGSKPWEKMEKEND